ncbi:MAG: hypothetical protein II488_07165, partial [Firmicutes bacterium]|nr:hypothetical protein [Bacillota bacterium]
MYNALKAARRAYRRISDYNELTPRERMFVGRLLRDEEDAATLFREKDIRYLKVLSEATAVYNYSKLGSMLGEYRGMIHTEANKTALDAIGGSENFRKMRDVPQKLLASAMTTGRVFDYIAGNDYEMAERLKDAYVKPITRSNGAEERLKQRVKDRISALNIDKSIRKGNKVSEDYAVQFIGEKMSEIEALEDKESKWRKQHDSTISDIRSQLDGGVQKNGRPLTEKMRQNLEERLNNHESKEMPEYKNEAGQTLEELRAEVEAFKNANRNLDYNRIENDLVPVFREIYNDLFEKMNEARVANGYEPVDYRRGYFPHFTREDTSAMVRFAKSLGMEFDNKVLPTSIQGLTHEFRPGINWFSAAQERTGTNTDFSAQEGMDRYLEGVAKVIYRTENITKMRALANTIRRLADPKFDRFIKDVYSDKTKSEEEKYAAVEQKWRNELSDDKKAQRQALSYFVTWLDERTNIYAGKATNFDRLLRENLQVRTDKGLWKLLGFATDLPRGMVTRYGGNTVSINPGSWLTNFAPIFEVSAEVNPKYVLQALGSLKKDLREGFTEESNFLTARSGTDPLFTVADIGRTQMNHQGALKWLEGLGNVMKGAVNWGAKPMELIDGVTSYVVTRAYYLSNLDKGMSHDAALDLADNQAGDLMADRAPGKLPILMEIKNPIAKGFTQFQTEVLNSLEHNTHDVFGEIRKRYADDPKRGRAVIKSILRYMGFALRKSILLWLCNELYEALVGRRFMPDPIDWANEFRGDLTGN